ncbi:zinc-binding alcohol dehydrogenase family protein [Novosphingobium sp. KCTC 2891]|uniref:quinone oxidoreductase family protein n=1 Tax=Novosphingobium sp. KCTC 2891 TaxID=2989730 RepID=UPI00222165EA|nr:zinc-binding alcohol dehydrogenase family protein [Novosphingobium sp. KCTC 2891]MCW1383612.1 zinc-binding alcohol dehydrogenase family protein [Novosphingobium sp. KCTC 2891]
MRAWMIESQSGPQALKQIEIDKPVASGTEILVRMTAPGVVPFDVAIINDENEPGFPPSSLPLVPGNQGAGVVEDAGTCPRLKVGDRVMFGAFPYGFMRAGSWAEYCTVEQDHAWKIPDSVSDGAAAQAAVAYPTAYRALVEAGFAAGKTVLAPGIGGSVGNAAYQLARALGAAKVIGTTSSSAKAEQARAAGFENVINLSRQSMVEGVHAMNGGEGVDIVIDSLGGQVLAETAKCIKRYSKIICLGFAAGRQSTISLADLILHRGSIQGYGVYTCTPAEWADAWTVFTRLADEGSIKPLFDRSFPFDRAPEALEYVAKARPFGGVALTM